jgi:nitroreductase
MLFFILFLEQSHFAILFNPHSLDAGHLGQRLNLAAIYLGLGVSGIGGFFDDQVNDVLGIPADEAVIYITTIGKPS